MRNADEAYIFQADAAKLKIQASPAASSITISSAVRPEGNARVTVRNRGSRSVGARF